MILLYLHDGNRRHWLNIVLELFDPTTTSRDMLTGSTVGPSDDTEASVEMKKDLVYF